MNNYIKPDASYYVAVRPQTNELHSVHREGCPFMPDDSKRIFLGNFPTGDDALMEGQKYYRGSTKCRFCSKEHSKEITEPALAVIDDNAFIPSESQISRLQNGSLYYFLN
jgi:hypothetical protein